MFFYLICGFKKKGVDEYENDVS
jgi:hypothetical protein